MDKFPTYNQGAPGVLLTCLALLNTREPYSLGPVTIESS